MAMFEHGLIFVLGWFDDLSIYSSSWMIVMIVTIVMIVIHVYECLHGCDELGHPLVNVYITMGKKHMIHGRIPYFYGHVPYLHVRNLQWGPLGDWKPCPMPYAQ